MALVNGINIMFILVKNLVSNLSKNEYKNIVFYVKKIIDDDFTFAFLPPFVNQIF